jgi:hypothetical protein
VDKADYNEIYLCFLEWKMQLVIRNGVRVMVESLPHGVKQVTTCGIKEYDWVFDKYGIWYCGS